MIKVLFFAQTRELVGTPQLLLDEHFQTADQLRIHLSKRSKAWQLALESDQLLVSINQEVAGLDSEIKDGDEVAFFPPVTGG